jgi:hypothetical protein
MCSPNFSAGHATTRSRISNRSRLLPGVDGRSAGARRFRDVCASCEAEVGGGVTEIERDLIRLAAALTLCAEQSEIVLVQAINSDGLIRLSSEARRIPGALRSKAGKRDSANPRRMGLSKAPARPAAALVARSETAADCIV